MISRKYQLINNISGWAVFIIALVTYWLTLEPTASYWDCGEFIIQADKLEVGHPPGNPIFMLTARFFANFASSPATVSVMVNAMSGLLSALTILLLFWTITHLVRKLVVKDGTTSELTLQQYLAVMGSGVVGALAYCWSDTFWFSAVEGEVYAFSSFCTALVFWLILKWENRADDPGSDRYLILIAYIIGVSVAVHLLNLLCIPAIVLVFAYRKYKDMTLLKSVIALLVSFVIIVFVLYGLVPGFIKVAQQFELFFVNAVGMSFNSGALIYAFVTAAVFIWAIYEFYRGKSQLIMRISFAISVLISGMLFIGSGVWIGIVLMVALLALLFGYYHSRPLPQRVMNIILWSIAVIFVGYSSYALILIRSSADTPMNQNSPDNVFDLASYLNREQYGQTPLLYGQTLNSGQYKEFMGFRTDTLGVDENNNVVTLNTPQYSPVIEKGHAMYVKGVKGVLPEDPDGFLTQGDMAANKKASTRRDYYVKRGYNADYKLNPELNMLFPRIYSSMHRSAYGEWVNLDTMPDNIVQLHAIDTYTGDKPFELDTRQEPVINEVTGLVSYPVKTAYKPSFGQNLSYFFNYQLNHMYMRYFMWNFAGRQNDILNQHGEMDAGNWISGIPFIDTPRLGDQSMLPDDLGKNNKGHNVYFMLPLLLGILGLLWQAFAGRRGIEQFWVVFFLFFMTGIAIVLYLNQPPGQPRERDYAFAGSFYAYAIWIGMGVAALWRILLWAIARKKYRRNPNADDVQVQAIVNEETSVSSMSRICAVIACVLSLIVPLQMVSQTWDDHDRTGRYAARDYGANYLESLEPNAIVFCNGDNDTFPLWYAQEVEGVRPDVKIVNLSYLASDWYANQQRMQSYTAAPIKFTATPADYAYGKSDVVFVPQSYEEPMTVLEAIKRIYKGEGRNEYGYPTVSARYFTIPVDRNKVIERGLVAPRDTAMIVDSIRIDVANAPSVVSKGYLSLSELLMLDIIATNAANGWERPIYWASTVGPEYHLNLTAYLRSTGMTHQLVPTMQDDMVPRADRAYDVVTRKYRWGGADAPAEKSPYFDETANRMLATMRGSMLDLAQELIYQGDVLRDEGDTKGAGTEYGKSLKVLDLMYDKLRPSVMKYGLSLALTHGQLLCELGDKERLNRPDLTKKGLAVLEETAVRYAQYARYSQYINTMFVNPSLTVETQLISYQYYHIVELYTKYGGDINRLKKKVEPGIKLDTMKKLYEQYMQIGIKEPSGDSEPGSVKALLETVAQYAEVVNTMASLSPEEYAAASAEEKEIDSMFYEIYDLLRDMEIDITELEKNNQFKMVDKNRSRRINEQYRANHPEKLEK